jgi:S1-C subfamily serine protease
VRAATGARGPAARSRRGAGRGLSVLSGGRRRARLAPAVLAVLALASAIAAALAIAALLRTDAPRAPAASPVTPLRVASGHGIATGFGVADRRVVTVAHVIDGPVTVRGRRVRVLRLDRRNDLALLAGPGVRAGAPDLRAGAPDLRPRAPEMAGAADGQHLRVVRLRGGALSLLSVDVRRSIVAHVRVAGAQRAVARPALELSARVAPGDSGAPVITDDGVLAGVVFAASRNRADTAYAVDATAVMELLRPR